MIKLIFRKIGISVVEYDILKEYDYDILKEYDITNYEQLEKFFEENIFSCIIYLTAQADLKIFA